MKNKKSFPNFIFHSNTSGLNIILLLLFNIIVIAQETPDVQNQFYIGTEFHNNTIEDTRFYAPFYTSGMNTLSQRADDDLTWEYINGYNILACNVRYKTDWIAYYTTCYYSKWEAEDQTDLARVGIKHDWGQSAVWEDTVTCWSTIGISEPKQNVIYGPHYRQDRRYKRGLYDPDHKDSVRYNVRFNMALNYDTNYVSLDENVCIIKVIYTYKEVYSNDSSIFIDEPFLIDTLKVGEFNIDGRFEYFNFDDRTYKYPERFFLPAKVDNRVNPPQYDLLYYTDSESYTGIQFCVDWLRDDDLCTLYVDNVEVYDNDGWQEYIEAPQDVIIKLQTYTQNYNNPDPDWTNIKYWVGSDEPYSIDAYTPLRIVDSLLRDNDAPPLLVHLYPFWNIKINEDSMLARYYRTAKPDPLNIHFFQSELNIKKQLYFEYLMPHFSDAFLR